MKTKDNGEYLPLLVFPKETCWPQTLPLSRPLEVKIPKITKVRSDQPGPPPELRDLRDCWGQDGPSWTQVGTKNLSESFPEAFSKVIIFLIGCGVGFVAIWCQLGSNLAAKTLPKSTQVGSKIYQKINQDTDPNFLSFLIGLETLF